MQKPISAGSHVWPKPHPAPLPRSHGATPPGKHAPRSVAQTSPRFGACRGSPAAAFGALHVCFPSFGVQRTIAPRPKSAAASTPSLKPVSGTCP